MSKNETNVARNTLTGERTPVWTENPERVAAAISSLQSKVQNIENTYLKQPWITANENLQPYSIQSDITASADRILLFRLEDFYKEHTSNDQIRGRYFEDSRWAIQEVLALALFLKNIPQKDLISIPMPTLLQIQGSASSMAECMKVMREVSSYHPKKDDELPHSEYNIEISKKKRDWEKKFNAIYRDFYDAVLPLKSSLYTAEILSLKEQVQRLNDQNTTHGVERHNSLYEEQANKHSWAAWGWLILGGAVTAGTIVYATYFVQEIERAAQAPKAITNELLFSLVALRIFVFGLLSSTAFWGFKNYRLSKHNELLNKQKALALGTFTEFANASGADVEMRKVILNKVTSTIFDSQHLGYIDAESSADTSGALSFLEGLIAKKQ